MLQCKQILGYNLGPRFWVTKEYVRYDVVKDGKHLTSMVLKNI